jgi:uncharacterized protein (DUF885 family)
MLKTLYPITYIITFFFILNFNVGLGQNKKRLENQLNTFVKTYKKIVDEFGLLSVRMNYKENLKRISANENMLNKQKAFFDATKIELDKNYSREFAKAEQIKIETLLYEIELHQERIQLEREWLKKKVKNYPINNLSKVPLGKKWYKYWLKSWVTDDVTPKQIFEFGLKEIEKVKSEIKVIQNNNFPDSLSFYKTIKTKDYYSKEPAEVEKLITKKMKVLLKNYSKLFPYTCQIPTLKIKESKEPRLNYVPAYYRNNAFYFNLPNGKFNMRLTDIFLIHEGYPGHHYQVSLEKIIKNKLFSYNGYKESWAAYVESLGKELGLYNTWSDYLGKWEWDIVRSVRVCLDVGLNYYGWSDEQAIAFWKKHIPNQDDIIQRELNRMKTKPAQVITYKYGANEIMKLREMASKHKDFSLLKFHTQVLNIGEVPIKVLKKHL